MEDLGRALDQAIRDRGLSNADLARLLGVTPQQTYIWRTNPSWNTKTLFAVCDALDISVEKLRELAKST